MPNLKTFETLEDAVVELSNCLHTTNPQGKLERKIHPARYDFGAINSIAKQISKGVAFTDRQQELAVKLVTKYRRQWKKIGVDVSNISIETPVKLPIRTDVDREHIVSVTGSFIEVKFPYKPQLISMLAQYRENSRGPVLWDENKKVWKVFVSDSNVQWIKKFAKDHKLNSDKSFIELCDRIDEAYDYNSIQFDVQDKQLVLHDAPESMLTWIHTNIGKVEMKNFIKLVSYSHYLGVTLSENVKEYAYRNYPNTYRQILNRHSFISSSVESLRELLLKVKQLDLDSIAFYVVEKDEVEPLCKQLVRMLPDYNITIVTNGEASWTENYTKSWSHSPYKTKEIVVTNRTLTSQPDLIISFAGFMAGPGRRDWFSLAHKLIYYCHDIDNKIKKTIKKHESNFNNKR